MLTRIGPLALPAGYLVLFQLRGLPSLRTLDADTTETPIAEERQEDIRVSTKSLSIALVTPYTGGNLGDGAIQEAVIASMRRRFPNARIVGITLNPNDTRQRHGINAFPITALVSPRHQDATACRTRPRAARTQMPTVLERAGRRAAKLLARASLLLAKLVVPSHWRNTLRNEVPHIVKGFTLLKGVNLLVFSGGGQLDDEWGGPWAHPYALLKWAILARLRGARPIFLSVGFGTLNSRVSRLFTRTALALASYRSYRDAGSRELARAIGFRRDDPVFPDLAYSYPLERLSLIRNRPKTNVVIGLCPFCYCDPRFWPRKDATVYDSYLQILVQIIRSITFRGLRVSLFASGSFDDRAIDDLLVRITAELEPDTLQLVERHEAGMVDRFLELAGRVNLVVASRLHSLLLAQLVGTPTIAISYERKVDVQMDAVGLSEYRLSIDEFKLEDFESCFDRILAREETIRSQIRASFAAGRSQLETQYDAIFSA